MPVRAAMRQRAGQRLEHGRVGARPGEARRKGTASGGGRHRRQVERPHEVAHFLPGGDVRHAHGLRVGLAQVEEGEAGQEELSEDDALGEQFTTVLRLIN